MGDRDGVHGLVVVEMSDFVALIVGGVSGCLLTVWFMARRAGEDGD